MNVLHITHTDVTDDSRIEKQVRFFSCEKQYAVTCIFVRSENYNRHSELDGVAHRSMVFSVKRGRGVPRVLRHIVNMLELSVFILIQGVRVKPEVIHAHDTLVLPAATILSLLCGSSLIYDAHELESNKNGQNKIMRIGTLLIEKVCWGRVDKFITVSESIRDWYFDRFSRRDSEIILNSPEGANANESNYLREKFSIEETCTVFIYIGYLSPGRGIGNILEAFSTCKDDKHVVFLGEGVLADSIVDAESRHANIHYHEPVKHTEVVSVASSADVGLCLIENVSLSDYFSLPNKLFEYLFSGLKIIGSEFPEIRSVVSQYNAGQVCSNNPSALIAAIESIEKGRLDANVDALTWAAQKVKLGQLYER